jgi:type I site-specific restriction endonuclease
MKNLILKLLFLLVAILCIGVAIYFFFTDRAKKRIIKENKTLIEKIYQNNKKLLNDKDRIEKLLSQRDEELRENINLSKLSSSQKDSLIVRYKKEIIRQDKIIKKSSDIINNQEQSIVELTEQLKKSTEKMDKEFKGFGFSLYIMPGVNRLQDLQSLNFSMIIGMDYTRYFFSNRFGLSIGGWANPINDISAGAKLGLTFSF